MFPNLPEKSSGSPAWWLEIKISQLFVPLHGESEIWRSDRKYNQLSRNPSWNCRQCFSQFTQVSYICICTQPLPNAVKNFTQHLELTNMPLYFWQRAFLSGLLLNCHNTNILTTHEPAMCVTSLFQIAWDASQTGCFLFWYQIIFCIVRIQMPHQ